MVQRDGSDTARVPVSLFPVDVFQPEHSSGQPFTCSIRRRYPALYRYRIDAKGKEGCSDCRTNLCSPCDAGSSWRGTDPGSR